MASKIVPAILEASIEHFSDRGYFGATTKEISFKADVTEPSVFRLFSSKDNLFREALRTAVNRTLDPVHFHALLHQAESGKPLGFPVVVLGAVRRWYSSVSVESARLLMHATLVKNREWRAIAYERPNKIIEILAARTEQEARRLKVRKLDSLTAARSLIFTLLYYRLVRTLLDVKDRPGELVETTVQQWIHGLFAE
jgi:AcrR family transcriptional regulator